MGDESLVVIGTYDAAADARDDVARLRAAGITGAVATVPPDEDGYTVGLQVAAVDADAAIALLSLPPEETAAVALPAPGICPRCQSPRSTRLPSRLVIAIAASVAVTAGLIWYRLWPWVVGWWLASGLLVRRVERQPQWHCLNCQWQWNDDIEAERRAERERHAATPRSAPE